MENKSLSLLKSEIPQLAAILKLNAAPGVDVNTLALQEIEYIGMQALTKPDINDCLPISVIMAVKNVLKQNLTLDPSAGLVYMQTRGVPMKNEKGQDVWVKVLEISPSCNGLLSINYQCGKILDHKIPVVKKNEQGKVTEVEFEYQVKSGRWEKRVFDESDFERWKIASHKQNARSKKDADNNKLNYANQHYISWKGGIDPEFARAKAIRHSLKKLGTNPNENKFVKISIPVEKQVIIDEEKEMLADSDGVVINNNTEYAEVISETKNENKTDISKLDL